MAEKAVQNPLSGGGPEEGIEMQEKAPSDGKVHREESTINGSEIRTTASEGITLQGTHINRVAGQKKAKNRVGRAGDTIKTKIGIKKYDPKTKLCIYLLTCIFLWSICGMWYYHNTEGWSWSGAMFYATNVGLGVGYGVYNITTAGSKWFTVFYCLMGSSFVAGGMGLFVGFYMEQSDERYDQKREEFLLRGQGTKEYLQHNTKDKRGKYWFLYLKHKFTVWAIIIFVALVVAGIIFSMVSGGQLGCPNETIPPPAGVKCYTRDKIPSNCTDPDLWNGADPETVSDNACWTVDCDIYSLSVTGNHCNDVAEALFFVVTSMSTASQVAPKNKPFQLWFTIFYIFIGIPIYGALLGMVADIYIQRYARKQDREDLNAAAAMTSDGFERMCAINCDHGANGRLLQAGEDALSPTSSAASSSAAAEKFGDQPTDNELTSPHAPVFWGDYLEYTLRRNELIDRKLLDLIKYNYYKLDTTRQGYFLREDVQDQFTSNLTSFPEHGSGGHHGLTPKRSEPGSQEVNEF